MIRTATEQPQVEHRDVAPGPRWAARGSLILALIAFLLGTAPFTPALLLTLVALPLATYAFFMGAKRVSGMALLWSMAALIAVPLADVTGTRIDHVLVSLGGCAVGTSIILFFQPPR